MKYFPRSKEKLKMSAIENWRIHSSGDRKFLLHLCGTPFVRQKPFNNLFPAAYKKGTEWKCNRCGMSPPDEIAFAAEVSFCQRTATSW